MICIECNGSRACDACDGYGGYPTVFVTILDECVVCDGTGACPGCFGDGEIPDGIDDDNGAADSARLTGTEAVR